MPDADDATPKPGPAPDAVPLCVDLDGTLIRGDLLHQSLFALLGDRPGRALRLPGWLAAGKAALKDRIAGEVAIDATRLPYRADVLAWLREQKAAGRPLVLATASHERYARAVADHLGLFDRVIASDADTNRRGVDKIAAIRAAVGDTFDYVGDSDADVPLVAACRRVALVEPTAALRSAAERSGKVERTFPRPAGPGPAAALLKLLRPHQWAKNLLLFVPLLVGHRLGEPALLRAAFLGFLAFCAAASSVYIVNDLVDIASDRGHPTKRHRPLAAGTVGVPAALTAAGGLLIGAALLALLAGGPAFLGWLGAYLVLTTAYSFVFKKRVLLDVLLLAWLYTHRVMAGGAVVDITLTPWLIAFSSFVFLSIAFAKRYAELKRADADDAERNPRRGYRPDDLPLIGNAGPAAGMAATLVLALYIQSNDVISRDLYAHREVLWLILPLFLYWILRVWLIAFRGDLDEDPIAFAIRDRMSYVCLVAAAVVMIVAT